MPFTPVVFIDGVTPLNKGTFDPLQAGVIAAERTEYKGVANGYASLDATTKVPVAQLPDLSGTYLTKPAYATTLPASPVDGQEAILVDSLAAPTYTWRFRYNAGHTSDAYKWEFIGGSQFTQYEATSVGVNVGATLGPVGPIMTIPRAGFYTVRHVSFAFNTATTVAYIVGCWVAYPSAAALSGSDSPNAGLPAANTANVFINENLVFVPSAGQQICIGLYSAHASTFSRQRTHSILPVRVI